MHKSTIEKHFIVNVYPIVIPYVSPNYPTAVGFDDSFGSPTIHSTQSYTITREDWFSFNKRAEYNYQFEELLK